MFTNQQQFHNNTAFSAPVEQPIYYPHDNMYMQQQHNYPQDNMYGMASYTTPVPLYGQENQSVSSLSHSTPSTGRSTVSCAPIKHQKKGKKNNSKKGKRKFEKRVRSADVATIPNFKGSLNE